MFTPIDKSCSLSSLYTNMQKVEMSCCKTPQMCNATAVPSMCTVDCAIAFSPFFRACGTTLNAMYDVRGADTVRDGTAPRLSKQSA